MLKSLWRTTVVAFTAIALSMSLAIPAVAHHSSGHNHSYHTHGDVNWTFHDHYTVAGRHYMEWHWYNTTTGESGDYSRSFCISYPCATAIQ